MDFKRKITNKLFGIIFLFVSLGSNTSFAQEITERDLRVFEEVACAFLEADKQDGNSIFYKYTKSCQATYIPKTGVLLTIPSSPEVIDLGESSSNTKIYYLDGQVLKQVNSSSVTPDVEGDEIDEKEQKKIKAQLAANLEQNEALYRQRVEQLKETMIDFLKEYGDLLRKLPDNEKVILQASLRAKNQSKSEAFVVYGNAGTIGKPARNKTTINASVLMGDIRLYRKRELNEKDFEGRISFVETKNEKYDQKDFQIFSKVLTSLYDTKNPDSFHFRHIYFISTDEDNRRFKYIPNVGVSYNLALTYDYNKGNSDSDFGRVVTGLSNLSKKRKEELDEKLMDIYGNFKRDFSSNVLDYGRTIKSLNSEESLMIEVQMPFCFECEMPDNLKFTVPASTISAYNRGDINLDEAIEQVMVQESGKSRLRKGETGIKGLDALFFSSDND